MTKHRNNATIATIHMDENGRTVEIDGHYFNVHDVAREQHPGLDDLFDQDEDAYVQLVKDAEDALLHSHQVTHVIDPESFDDDKEHSLQEYMTLCDFDGPC